ncbi:hypothetical protein B0H34DRAFT_679384 [Crassisporium funariophilum]|nr:hypothetical protein B0H34DRAFT_679384 [Crassisporium funariophilum]
MVAQPSQTDGLEGFVSNMNPWEPLAGFSRPIMPNNEEGGSASTSALKRKRSASNESSPAGAQSQALPSFSELVQHMDSDSEVAAGLILLSEPSNASGDPASPLRVPREGKGKAKATSSDDVIFISDSPTKEITSAQKGKGKETVKQPSPPPQAVKKSKSELLSGYTCPICFSPPTNATLTPCGHICCGVCLFTAVKTTMQRATVMLTPEGGLARCPVCRATIPGWDGKGGGVIGLKARAIFTL